MFFMLNILKMVEVVIAILLILVILVQQKRSSFDLTSFSNSSSGKFERRWPEKTLHQITIWLGAIYVILSLVYFFMA